MPVSSLCPVNAKGRKALAILAEFPNGCPEPLLVHTYGVSIELLVELSEAGLAKVRVERVVGPPTGVKHVEITEAGREAARQ